MQALEFRAHYEPTEWASALSREELLCALRAGLLRRRGATKDGKVVVYELTHLGVVLLSRAQREQP